MKVVALGQYVTYDDTTVVSVLLLVDAPEVPPAVALVGAEIVASAVGALLPALPATVPLVVTSGPNAEPVSSTLLLGIHSERERTGTDALPAARAGLALIRKRFTSIKNYCTWQRVHHGHLYISRRWPI